MMDSDDPIVHLDNVGLRYGTDKEVLSGVNCSLHAGQFYFLTGASGAGKTSLLKILYLAQTPSRGALRMFGTDMLTVPPTQLPSFRRRLGVVFQDFRLVEHMDAYDNIALPLRVAGVRERDLAEPVSDMLEWVGLEHRAHAKPATLSGGEQQRVAIARAVITRPDMLVADEPTGNVDADMAMKLLSLFHALNRLGTTVVVATHDLQLVRRMPDATIMRLEKGQLKDPTGALRYPPKPERQRMIAQAEAEDDEAAGGGARDAASGNWRDEQTNERGNEQVGARGQGDADGQATPARPARPVRPARPGWEMP